MIFDDCAACKVCVNSGCWPKLMACYMICMCLTNGLNMQYVVNVLFFLYNFICTYDCFLDLIETDA